MDYRFNPNMPHPDWYSPVDPTATDKMWAVDKRDSTARNLLDYSWYVTKVEPVGSCCCVCCSVLEMGGKKQADLGFNSARTKAIFDLFSIFDLCSIFDLFSISTIGEKK